MPWQALVQQVVVSTVGPCVEMVFAAWMQVVGEHCFFNDTLVIQSDSSSVSRQLWDGLEQVTRELSHQLSEQLRYRCLC